MTDYIFDLPIPPKIREGIGIIAAEWSMLEATIESTLWSIAKLDARLGATITTHAGFRNCRDALLALIRDRFPNCPEIDELGKLMTDDLNKLYGERNRYVHGIWDHDTLEGGARLLIFSARGKVKSDEKDVTCAELLTTANKIKLAYHALGEHFEKLGIFPHPSMQKQP